MKKNKSKIANRIYKNFYRQIKKRQNAEILKEEINQLINISKPEIDDLPFSY